MMKTCCYCGSQIEPNEQHYYCDFCEMKIGKANVQQDGKRKNFLQESQPSNIDAEKSTPELMTYTTIELMFMLKIARKERSDTYHTRHTFIQAMKTGADEFQNGERYTYDMYDYWTRKCLVLENLIRERIGYIPHKLTESYIQNLAARMEESTKKRMTLRKARSI
ncbi:hypothetical protein [Halobacillus amylolyticus]|uniref:Uncharacterized protein n=1 Tax=Halobacillus amylolyticus TaxID=2932259 RepID=A0ABY4HCK4_9BACI|nr:hypothetical protein [Halobacillus amylolyticus]UOR12625.1 hypothetical protein MUO15_03640 [Halobacillus amylolyticus]